MFSAQVEDRCQTLFHLGESFRIELQCCEVVSQLGSSLFGLDSSTLKQFTGGIESFIDLLQVTEFSEDLLQLSNQGVLITIIEMVYGCECSLLQLTGIGQALLFIIEQPQFIDCQLEGEQLVNLIAQ